MNTGAAPSSQKGSRTAAGSPSAYTGVSGVLTLLFIAVAIAVVFHILGVRFFVEVRR
jgi:hypothetical protein